MLIAAPGDEMETRACVRYLVNHPQPSYLRLGRAGASPTHDKVPEISPGVWLKVTGDQTDKRQAVISTGGTLELAVRATLSNPHLNGSEVFSLPLWGMETKRLQNDQLRHFKRVISIEDHLTDGGFGSWLLESADRSNPPEVVVRGLHSDVCGAVASQGVLNDFGGLTEAFFVLPD
jgi:transketolase